MYYLNKIVGFAISPIGIAVFGGLLVLLCARLKLPRLAKCPPSHFGKTGLTYRHPRWQAWVCLRPRQMALLLQHPAKDPISVVII